jgi:alpha-tubulin suppressor-like RCC1 family protein
VQALAAYGQRYCTPQQAHVCVILTMSGQVWCWGSSGSGEVGPGVATGMVAYTPVQVPLPGNDPAVTIAAGPAFTCASTASQKVYCWGDNGYGQLGQSPPGGSFPSPVQVPGITNAKGVTALDSHTCAWLADGTVMCWGLNDFGQLGAGDFDLHAGPVAVKGVTTAMQVTAGSDHTCALLNGGSVTCWGSSYLGEVGTGKYGIYPTPQQVLGL